MSSRTALLVGGTGPTGPHLLDGLHGRGFTVTMFHRGLHEVSDGPDVEHVHGDPNLAQSIDSALRGREFDVVVATYGRLRHVADVLAGRCAAFLGVSGLPAYAGFLEPDDVWPAGLPLAADESFVGADRSQSGFARAVRATERHVLSLHAQGQFAATLFRYPGIYGPRQVYPSDWSFVRRCIDRRPFVILPDGGLTIETRCAAANAAATVLRALDRPEAAAGRIFNVADSQQYSLWQWVQAIAQACGASMRIESLPYELAGPGRDLLTLNHNQHVLVSADCARTVLGHQDVIAPLEALQSLVEWYMAYPPSPEIQAVLKDRFDYAAEDDWLSRYRAATANFQASTRAAFQHAYEPAGPTDTGPA